MTAESVRLGDAALCLDCDAVYDASRPDGAGRRACPRCGSAAWWPVGMWLPRMWHGDDKVDVAGAGAVPGGGGEEGAWFRRS